MKIALVGFHDGGWLREEPGLGIIAACLRQAGHEVLLTDIDRKSIVLDEIINFNPKIIGFTAYSDDKKILIKICKELRGKVKDSILCAGGYLPTYYTEEFLKESSDIDFLVIGEGEIVLLNIVNRIMNNNDYSNVKGIAYRSDNKIIINPPQEPLSMADMDNLPYQSRDLIIKYKIKRALISTSRGCKKQCTFCCSRNFWGGWKGKSISRIVDEIEYMVNEYRIYTFQIIDNSFEDSDGDSKNGRALSFANEVLNRKLNISYFFNLRAESYKCFSEEDITVLKKSGLVGLYIGIESGNQMDLKLYGKTATLKDNVECLNFWKEHEICPDIGFINFNPYSTLTGLTQNIDFLEKNGLATMLLYVVNSLRIDKGIYLYQKMLRDNLLKLKDYSDFYDYNYIDPNIEKLAAFVGNFYYNELPIICNYGVILSHTMWQKFNFGGLKRNAKNDSIYKIIRTAEDNIQEILQPINASNSQWFRMLIANAKNWNEAEAIKITDHFFNGDTLRKQITKLQQISENAINELKKADRDMSFYIEKFYVL